MKRLAVALILGLGVLAPAATLINGAGATFPFPLYSKWFSDYNKLDADTAINYQSVGSGTGIQQFIAKTVDFGASDAPMTDEQLVKAGGAAAVVHVPTVLGAVVITYNVPNAPADLKLSRKAVADIFLGKITKWNDPETLRTNPGAKMTGDVLVARRSDGSGTTAIFTDFLAKVSPDWLAKVGRGTAVNWPVGLGGKGNEGVTQVIKQTPGSIGYVELIYAEKNKLPYASVENASGAYIKPSLASVTAAAAASAKLMPEDFRVSITNAAGKDSYPVAGFTYLLVYKQQTDGVKGEKLVKFLKWAMKEGQSSAGTLSYASLPATLVKKVEAKIATIEVKKIN